MINDVKADPKNTTVTILGKDYNNSFFLTFMVTTYTSSKLIGNVSLAPEIVIPLGLECNTSYNFTITVSEAVSGTVIDEYCGKLCGPKIEVGSNPRNFLLIISVCVGAFLFGVLLVVAVTIIAIGKKYSKGEICIIGDICTVYFLPDINMHFHTLYIEKCAIMRKTIGSR